MQIFFEKVPLNDNTSLIVRRFEVVSIEYPYHSHPEYELTYIVSGNGKRLVGDSVEDFNSGDLVLLGSDLPHQWVSSPTITPNGETCVSYVLQFHKDFLGKESLERKEMHELKKLLGFAQNGIHFSGFDPELLEKKFINLLNTNSLSQISNFIELLNFLISYDKKRPLTSASYRYEAAEKNNGQNKINKVYGYLLEHFQQDVRLENVSSILNMSVSSFCHFFRRRTGKNFSEILNEIRLGFACKLLQETEKQIIEICFESGFQNLSYFNRKFKQEKKLSPLQYRKKFR